MTIDNSNNFENFYFDRTLEESRNENQKEDDISDILSIEEKINITKSASLQYLSEYSLSREATKNDIKKKTNQSNNHTRNVKLVKGNITKSIKRLSFKRVTNESIKPHSPRAELAKKGKLHNRKYRSLGPLKDFSLEDYNDEEITIQLPLKNSEATKILRLDEFLYYSPRRWNKLFNQMKLAGLDQILTYDGAITKRCFDNMSNEVKHGWLKHLIFDDIEPTSTLKKRKEMFQTYFLDQDQIQIVEKLFIELDGSKEKRLKILGFLTLPYLLSFIWLCEGDEISKIINRCSKYGDAIKICNVMSRQQLIEYFSDLIDVDEDNLIETLEKCQTKHRYKFDLAIKFLWHNHPEDLAYVVVKGKLLDLKKANTRTKKNQRIKRLCSLFSLSQWVEIFLLLPRREINNLRKFGYIKSDLEFDIYFEMSKSQFDLMSKERKYTSKLKENPALKIQLNSLFEQKKEFANHSLFLQDVCEEIIDQSKVIEKLTKTVMECCALNKTLIEEVKQLKCEIKKLKSNKCIPK